MIDFHSHILPAIDDGSKNVNMSIEMLEEGYRQGITQIIATPHFYPSEEHGILQFLEKRQYAYEEIAKVQAKRTIPKIHLGAEVYLGCDLSDVEDVEKLCVEGTNTILIEMPFNGWKQWMFECIYSLKVDRGLRPVMAHIDRYIDIASFDLGKLIEAGAAFQLNAESFDNSKWAKRIGFLFENNAAHVLGSDMHNTTSRACNIGKAIDYIESVAGQDWVDFFDENARNVLENKPLRKKQWEVKKKKGWFFKR